MTLEVPLLYLSSRSDSGVVVTRFRRRRTGARRQQIGDGRECRDNGAPGRRWGYQHDRRLDPVGGWGRGPQSSPHLLLENPHGRPGPRFGDGHRGGGTRFFGLQVAGQCPTVRGGGLHLPEQQIRLSRPQLHKLSRRGGIQATDRLFVSLLAKGSSARSDGADAQAEGGSS